MGEGDGGCGIPRKDNRKKPNRHGNRRRLRAEILSAIQEAGKGQKVFWGEGFFRSSMHGKLKKKESGMGRTRGKKVFFFSRRTSPASFFPSPPTPTLNWGSQSPPLPPPFFPFSLGLRSLTVTKAVLVRYRRGWVAFLWGWGVEDLLFLFFFDNLLGEERRKKSFFSPSLWGFG